MKKNKKEIKDYDSHDTSSFINPNKTMKLSDLGFELPPVPPTQVVSIRIPSHLLNSIKAKASQNDIPYQALIKMALAKYIGQPI